LNYKIKRLAIEAVTTQDIFRFLDLVVAKFVDLTVFPLFLGRVMLLVGFASEKNAPIRTLGPSSRFRLTVAPR
jgi:hypothetical protein